MDKVKEIVLNIIKSVDWIEVADKAYQSHVRPELQKYVADTESKIDDTVLGAFDVLFNFVKSVLKK